jgi:hypothetical protein
MLRITSLLFLSVCSSSRKGGGHSLCGGVSGPTGAVSGLASGDLIRCERSVGTRTKMLMLTPGAWHLNFSDESCFRCEKKLQFAPDGAHHFNAARKCWARASSMAAVKFFQELTSFGMRI